MTIGTSAEAASQVLQVINTARSRVRLKPYTVLPGLTGAAAAHNAFMAGARMLSHQCPDEPDLGIRISARRVNWTAVGENVGQGGPVPADVAAIIRMAIMLTRGMLAEKPPHDGHRQNILSGTFRYVGITVSRDFGGTVWLTQDFAR